MTAKQKIITAAVAVAIVAAVPLVLQNARINDLAERNSQLVARLPSERAASPTALVTGHGSEVGFSLQKNARTIGAGDMQELMTTVMGEKDPLKRAGLFAELLEQLTPENAKDAFLALKESQQGRRGPLAGGGNEMRLLLNAWGRLDGEGVIAELTALREADVDGGNGGRGPGGRGGFNASGDGGRMDFMSAISGWATADPSAASDYVGQLEAGRESSMYTASVIQGMMVNGVDGAIAFIGTLSEEDSARGRYMGLVAGEMLEGGIESAIAWTDGLTDPDLRGGAVTKVATAYASDDMAAAAAWVKGIAGEDYATQAVARVAEQWAQSDPQAVLEWAVSLPETSQGGAFVEALDEWTEQDPVAASEYLAQMPESAARDNGIEGFATQLAREDPQSAIAWAESISDEALRQETLVEVAQSWFRTDQTAVQTWLESSGLPQASQQAVQEAPSISARRDRRR